MTWPGMDWAGPMHRGYARSKREQAADLINQGRKLAREALEEENREAALDREYGPRIEARPAAMVPERKGLT